jgi:trans-2,3-dihydro-3-hydroxyanthranilate isomerase
VPRILSVGVRFLYVELKDLEALAASEAAQGPLTRISVARGLDGVFIYTRTGEETGNGIDIRARMFAPVHGVMEDAASGSANAGLANILASVNGEPDETLRLNVSQGIEMGRPSRMQVTAERNGKEVVEVRVTGGAVVACRGQIDVPEDK